MTDNTYIWHIFLKNVGEGLSWTFTVMEIYSGGIKYVLSLIILLVFRFVASFMFIILFYYY